MDLDLSADGPAPWMDPGHYWPALSAAVAGRGTPLVTLDLTALEHNAADLVRRAGGMTIRVASKSVRSRPVAEAVLATQGYAGLLTYSLREAVWAAGWCEDVLMGYPTTDRAAIAELLADEQALRRVTLLIDSTDHLDVVDAVAPAGQRPEVRVAIDLDLAPEPPRAGEDADRSGAFRSPAEVVDQAGMLARAVVDRPGFRLVGVLGYEAPITGVGGQSGEERPGLAQGPRAFLEHSKALFLRRMQTETWADVLHRRTAMVAAITGVAEDAGVPLELVNGGGTGSVHLTRDDPSVTEIAAGSGLFGAKLFDRYRAFAPAPAAAFALPVVRRPAGDIATVAGGGWIASGPPGADRVPTVTWPRDVELIEHEGVGEVQTPLRGPGARELALGELTWWRHAKAGELAEHTNSLLLVRSRVEDDQVRFEVAETVPTYRGEGKAFG